MRHDEWCPDVDEPQWFDRLTPEQLERFGGLVDSRVRLLGEPYSRAVDQCRYNISDENRAWVLGGEEGE